MSRWIFLILGFGIGVAGGLYYTWLLSPVEYVRTAPDSLRADFRGDYLGLIASAYASSGDLVRARTRLALFPDLRPATELAALAQQRLAAGLVDTEANALSQLASALSRGPTRTPAPTTQGASGSPTPLQDPASESDSQTYRHTWSCLLAGRSRADLRPVAFKIAHSSCCVGCR